MRSDLKQNLYKDFMFGIPNGLNYHLHTFFSYSINPTNLEIKVTSRCNARCLMCKM